MDRPQSQRPRCRHRGNVRDAGRRTHLPAQPGARQALHRVSQSAWCDQESADPRADLPDLHGERRRDGHRARGHPGADRFNRTRSGDRLRNRPRRNDSADQPASCRGRRTLHRHSVGIDLPRPHRRDRRAAHRQVHSESGTGRSGADVFRIRFPDNGRTGVVGAAAPHPGRRAGRPDPGVRDRPEGPPGLAERVGHRRDRRATA